MRRGRRSVSVLFNEPKLLKLKSYKFAARRQPRFSALQRAEIAEIVKTSLRSQATEGFSALQRAEIAEMKSARHPHSASDSFSALQRAEIAEIWTAWRVFRSLS